ncbi:MAG: hypothetical protein WC955_04265 [Elusimicrobiota bacterium]
MRNKMILHIFAGILIHNSTLCIALAEVILTQPTFDNYYSPPSGKGNRVSGVLNTYTSCGVMTKKTVLPVNTALFIITKGTPVSIDPRLYTEKQQYYPSVKEVYLYCTTVPGSEVISITAVDQENRVIDPELSFSYTISPEGKVELRMLLNTLLNTYLLTREIIVTLRTSTPSGETTEFISSPLLFFPDKRIVNIYNNIFYPHRDEYFIVNISGGNTEEKFEFSIYDLMGNIVYNKQSGVLNTGYGTTLTWDGEQKNSGVVVPSGTYFVQVLLLPQKTEVCNCKVVVIQ